MHLTLIPGAPVNSLIRSKRQHELSWSFLNYHNAIKRYTLMSSFLVSILYFSTISWARFPGLCCLKVVSGPHFYVPAPREKSIQTFLVKYYVNYQDSSRWPLSVWDLLYHVSWRFWHQCLLTFFFKYFFSISL